MTQRKTRRPPKRKTGARKLKLSKETLKDLDASKGTRVKGGARNLETYSCDCSF